LDSSDRRNGLIYALFRKSIEAFGVGVPLEGLLRAFVQFCRDGLELSEAEGAKVTYAGQLLA
jgi:hypothetical protein